MQHTVGLTTHPSGRADARRLTQALGARKERYHVRANQILRGYSGVAGKIPYEYARAKILGESRQSGGNIRIS